MNCTDPIETLCSRLRIAQDESAFSGMKHEAFGNLSVRKKRPSESSSYGKRESHRVLAEIFPEGGKPPPFKVKRIKPVKLNPSVVRDFIRDNCDLIKTVPKDLVPGIERRIKRIFEKTSTPESLARYLEDECGLEDWQAERIIRDQMQKYSARARLESFRKAGVKLVRWVHGDSHEPRPWHKGHWPNGLNGGVFDIEHPPIIDPNTGERGWPGQLIGCKCHLEAVELKNTAKHRHNV